MKLRLYAVERSRYVAKSWSERDLFCARDDEEALRVFEGEIAREPMVQMRLVEEIDGPNSARVVREHEEE